MPSTNGANGNGRDPKTGRFLQGNPGGPGNPASAYVQRFRDLIWENTTEEDWIRLWQGLLEMALEGTGPDRRFAMREVLDRIVGKPKETVEVNGAIEQTLIAIRAGFEGILARPDLARMLERGN